jgi:hypothetical protein
MVNCKYLINNEFLRFVHVRETLMSGIGFFRWSPQRTSEVYCFPQQLRPGAGFCPLIHKRQIQNKNGEISFSVRRRRHICSRGMRMRLACGNLKIDVHLGFLTHCN